MLKLIFGLVVVLCIVSLIKNNINSVIRKRRMNEFFELQKSMYEDFFMREGITMPSLANSARHKSIVKNLNILWYFLVMLAEVVLLVFTIEKIKLFERIAGLLKLF